MNTFLPRIPVSLRRVVFVVVLGVVSFVSLWPRPYLDANVPAEIQSKDSWIHLGCYLALSLCFLWAWGRRNAPWRSRAMAALLSALFGSLMEVLQAIPALGRSCSWGDARQNCLGALLGALALPVLLWPPFSPPTAPGGGLSR